MTPVCVDELPDDPSVLKRMVIEHRAALAGRQLQVERAEREAAAALAARDAAVAEREAREAQIEQVRREAAGQMEAMRQRHQAEMDALLRRFYGPRNERFDPTQLLLFGRRIDTTPIDVKAVGQEAGQELVTRRARNRNRHNHGRGALPGHLPREVVNHDLKESEKFGADGRPLVCIGYEVSEQLGHRRGGLFVLEHRRFKYAPADYQQSDTGAKVVTADKPPQPIEKGLAAPCLLAYVITSKLADHLPLYRLERIFAREGVHVAQSTMCGWVLAAAELVAPLVLLMKRRVKQSRSIHSDETRVPVQAKGKCRPGRVWDWIGDEANPYTVFEYTPDRTNTWPVAWLEGYEGYLQADAGSSYDAVYRQGAPGTITEVGCWAHARRKFFDARETDSARAAQMLGMVRRLYKVEDDAAEAIAAMKDATPQRADGVRRELRQRESVPVLKRIKAWLDEQAKLVLPRSPMAEAVGYALNQWKALCVYAEHGFLDIDNNAAERALKLVALGRKNWLFVQNDKFGRAYATLYSLIASAQRHGLDPQAYLRGVLAQIVTTPMSELGQFLPDVWKARLAAEAGPAAGPWIPANHYANHYAKGATWPLGMRRDRQRRIARGLPPHSRAAPLGERVAPKRRGLGKGPQCNGKCATLHPTRKSWLRWLSRSMPESRTRLNMRLAEGTRSKTRPPRPKPPADRPPASDPRSPRRRRPADARLQHLTPQPATPSAHRAPMPPRANDVPRPPLMRLQFAGRLQVIAITGRSYRLRNRAGAGQAGQAGQGGHGGGSEGGQAGEAAGPDGLAAQEREGRRSTAGSEGFSPPEDTKIHPPVSSDGESDEQAEAPITTNAKTGRRHAR